MGFINNVAGTLASAVTYREPIINMMTAAGAGPLSVAAMAMIGQTFGQGILSG